MADSKEFMEAWNEAKGTMNFEEENFSEAKAAARKQVKPYTQPTEA